MVNAPVVAAANDEQDIFDNIELISNPNPNFADGAPIFTEFFHAGIQEKIAADPRFAGNIIMQPHPEQNCKIYRHYVTVRRSSANGEPFSEVENALIFEKLAHFLETRFPIVLNFLEEKNMHHNVLIALNTWFTGFAKVGGKEAFNFLFTFASPILEQEMNDLDPVDPLFPHLPHLFYCKDIYA